MNQSASHLAEKAMQCRRLAEAIPDHQDPTRLSLVALATEFEIQAKLALERGRAAEAITAQHDAPIVDDIDADAGTLPDREGEIA